MNARAGRWSRTRAERLSRGVVVRRRLPREFGAHTLYVSPGAMLRFWRRNLQTVDPQLFAWVRDHVNQGDSVWDIGAKVGMFALAAAHVAGAGGYVAAIEADTWLVGLLRRSVAALTGPVAPVDVVPAAVGGSLALIGFNIAERGRASNYLDLSAAVARQEGSGSSSCW